MLFHLTDQMREPVVGILWNKVITELTFVSGHIDLYGQELSRPDILHMRAYVFVRGDQATDGRVVRAGVPVT